MQQFSWAKAKGQHAKWPGDACRWAAAFAVAQPQRLASKTGRWAWLFRTSTVIIFSRESSSTSGNVNNISVLLKWFIGMITFSSRRFRITPKPIFLYQHRSPMHPVPPMSRPVTGNRSDGLKIGKALVGIHKMMCEIILCYCFWYIQIPGSPTTILEVLKIGWKLPKHLFSFKNTKGLSSKRNHHFYDDVDFQGLYILMSCPFGVLMLITCGSKPGATAPDAFRHLRPNPGFLSKSPHPHEDNSMERPV